jgi:GGDEF domain-containing protein
VRGLELGADDYITKPFDIDELRLRVQGAINRATREHLHEPRTGLPTGPLVSEEIQHKSNEGREFVAIGYSVEGLNAYHEVYGFVAANDVFNYAGSVIQKKLAEHGTPDDFIGITDDEFIILTHSDDADSLDAAIKTQFAQDVRAFYSFVDADKGGLMLHPGTDHEEFVPLMQFSSERKLLTAR